MKRHLAVCPSPPLIDAKMSQPFKSIVIPKSVSIQELFEMMYASEPDQKCIACGKIGKYRGWDSLCNRSCYYTLSDLFDSFENEQVAQPDARVVEYCTKYPILTHSFIDEKVRIWMARN